jgi:hypothetical protein
MNFLGHRELEGLFKTTTRRTIELKPGDIIHDEFGYHLIGSVTEVEPGEWKVLDYYESGQVDCPPDKIWDIIDPAALNPEAVQTLCECQIAEMEDE